MQIPFMNIIERWNNVLDIFANIRCNKKFANSEELRHSLQKERD